MQSCAKKMQQMKQDCRAYGMCMAKMQKLDEKLSGNGSSYRLQREKKRLAAMMQRTETLLDEVERNCGVEMRNLLLRVFGGKEDMERIARDVNMDERTLEMTVETCLFEVVVDHLHMKGEKSYA